HAACPPRQRRCGPLVPRRGGRDPPRQPARKEPPMRSVIWTAALFAVGCASAAKPLPSERKAERRATQKELATLEAPGLVIGEFQLSAKNAIIDGDTIRVQGLDSTLRLLGIDAEETFKHETARRACEAGWHQYLKDQRRTSGQPVKMAPPLGDEAKVFSQHFFDGVTTVRLERDHPKEVLDYYNRYLAYVMVQRD